MDKIIYVWLTIYLSQSLRREVKRRTKDCVFGWWGEWCSWQP